MKTFRPLELGGTGHKLRHPEEDTEERFRPKCDVATFEASAMDLGTAAEVVRRFNALPIVAKELTRVLAGVSPNGYVGDDVTARLRHLVEFVDKGTPLPWEKKP